ncbi:MAG: hypothetical protein GY699_06800 [Desulfobacteraceae bacterium]|nr:hypothetical protein [Desulfobacteraceae bacterium]
MIIITGKIHSGKSTLAMKLATHLEQKKLKIAGIIAKGLWKNSIRHGFDLIDLSTGKQVPFAKRQKGFDKNQVTPFKFFESGLKFGLKALDKAKCVNAEIIFVDEIGKLELAGDGWASRLFPLLSIKTAVHIWVVRENLIDEVCKKWKLNNPDIINCNEKNALTDLKFLCC